MFSFIFVGKINQLSPNHMYTLHRGHIVYYASVARRNREREREREREFIRQTNIT